MPNPPPNLPPPPLVLEYERADIAKRNATGGLFLMGGALAILGSLAFASILFSHRFFDNLLPLAISSLIVIWGIAYIAAAWLLRLNYRLAGWVALVMTSIKAVAWLTLATFALIRLYHDDLETTGRKLLITFLFALFTVGCLAIVVEIWQALRAPQLWRR